ncbi:mCG145342, partial [Mus musculus]
SFNCDPGMRDEGSRDRRLPGSLEYLKSEKLYPSRCLSALGKRLRRKGWLYVLGWGSKPLSATVCSVRSLHPWSASSEPLRGGLARISSENTDLVYLFCYN